MTNFSTYQELQLSLARISSAFAKIEGVLEELENNGVIDELNLRTIPHTQDVAEKNAWQKNLQSKTLEFIYGIYNDRYKGGINNLIDIKSPFFQELRYSYRITSYADILKMLEERKVIHCNFNVSSNGKKRITAFKFIRPI
jgi:uncharacterized protein YjgD (DUF1641 family)